MAVVQSGVLIEASHGGQCCGMTHIFAFPSSPSSTVGENKKTSDKDRAAWTKDYPHTWPHRHREYPAQTAEERLEAILKAIDGEREKGIVEVVLTTAQAIWWEVTLTKLSFIEVSSSVNSNSGNTIHVFHRITG